MSFDSTSGLLDGQRLLFDPAYFKADRQVSLPQNSRCTYPRCLNLSFDIFGRFVFELRT